uniref:Uncharacterized protein n=1 Tax=Helianthus annuus TaxID=4232 RepID=A0A251VEM9_HELAN
MIHQTEIISVYITHTTGIVMTSHNLNRYCSLGLAIDIFNRVTVRSLSGRRSGFYGFWNVIYIWFLKTQNILLKTMCKVSVLIIKKVKI